MKALYLFVNKHMKALAVILAAVCVLLYVGDYLTGWIDEI